MIILESSVVENDKPELVVMDLVVSPQGFPLGISVAFDSQMVVHYGVSHEVLAEALSLAEAYADGLTDHHLVDISKELGFRLTHQYSNNCWDVTSPTEPKPELREDLL